MTDQKTAHFAATPEQRLEYTDKRKAERKLAMECISALEGIDDPAAFMRAVRSVEGTWGHRGMSDAQRQVRKHLKGGDK